MLDPQKLGSLEARKLESLKSRLLVSGSWGQTLYYQATISRNREASSLRPESSIVQYSQGIWQGDIVW